MMISRLHYLTQDIDAISHQELAETACKYGIRWLQLRVKNKPYQEWLQIAKDVKQICKSFQTSLVINDNVEIAKEIDADGVHLGKSDISVVAARKILGNSKIIGGTANTIQDVLQLDNDGVNYIGLGPYKFTETKSNLSTILGIDGYSNIVQHYHNKLPIIAIGGIKIEDIKPLINTGIYGVAVSSLINLSNNKEAVVNEILAQLNLKS
jgi:thiamine-phosphate pyrophosphorylase